MGYRDPVLKIRGSKTFGVLVKSNVLCTIIDSHQHVNSNGGGMILMTNNSKQTIIGLMCLLLARGVMIMKLSLNQMLTAC